MACIDPNAFLTVTALSFFYALFPIISIAIVSLSISSAWKSLHLPAYGLAMVDVSLLSALYAFPGASLFFFTALGIAAIAIEILTPYIRHFLFRRRCQVASARDAIRQEGIRLRKRLYREATQLAVMLEIKEDQRSEVESVDLLVKGSSGKESAVRNKLPDSPESNVEHAQNTSQFDVEGWLLVANAERVASTVGKESSDVGKLKTEKDIEKNRRASF